jgi:long-subunit acyl-CoA synthetase (AMP-forming)
MSETGHDGRPRHPTPLPAITIGDYLTAVAARGPRPGEDSGKGGAGLTYAELALDVERVACGLLAVGIEKGDRIAIWAPHSTEWTLVQLAAARAGAVVVVLDGDWSTDQLDAALQQTNPRLLAAGGSERLASLQAARGRLSQIARLVALDGLPCPGRDDLTWAELLVAGSAIDPARLADREATLHPDDPASIEYEQLPDGELQATTLTHRDYVASQAYSRPQVGLATEQEQNR